MAASREGVSLDESKVQVHEGRRAGVVVSVRLKPDEAELLEALSERDGRTMSETLRVALHCLARAPRPGQSIDFSGRMASPTRGQWERGELEPVG